MPIIDIVARWTDPETGDRYTSLIVSMIEPPLDEPEVLARLKANVEEARQYEAGPITGMAVNSRTGKSRYNERMGKWPE